MRVLSFTVGVDVQPAEAFAALFGQETYAVWLDSGIHATSGISVMGSASRVVSASVTDATVTLDGVTSPGSVFDFLRRNVEDNRLDDGFPLGWFGYELSSQTMSVSASRHSRYPDAALVFLDRCVVFDHTTGEIKCVARGEAWTGELLA